MEAETIISMVSSLGFPIVMCLVLIWYVKYMTDKNNEEIKAIQISLEENTKVITELKTMVSVFMSYLIPSEEDELNDQH